MTAEDPLAEVIAEAARVWRMCYDPADETGPTLAGSQADAVRAHIAAVLDAEEAKWREPTKWPGRDARGGACDAIANLRRGFGGST